MGLIGTGGGILMLVSLVFMGFSMQQAVATTLFLQVIPNTLFGVWMYYTKGHLRVRESMIAAIATTIGVTVGSYIGSNKMIDEVYLYRALAALLFIACLLVLYFKCELPFVG